MKSINFLNRFLKGNRKYLLILVFVVIGYSIFNLLTPLIFAFVIDNVINLDPIKNPILQWVSDLCGGVKNIQNNLWIGGVLVLIVATISCTLLFLRGYISAFVGEKMCYLLRNDLYNHLQHLPYSFHKKMQTGDLIQRSTSDVETIRRFIAVQLSEMIYSIVTAVFALTVLYSIDHSLALIASVSMPFLITFAYFFFKKSKKLFLESDESEGDMSTMLQESLSGVRVIKAFNLEKREVERFNEKSVDYHHKTFQLIKALGAYWGTSDLLCLLQILLVVLFGIFDVRSGAITIGDFFVFISYVGMILWPIRNFGRLLSDMGKMSVSISRVQEIFDEEIEDTTSGCLGCIKGKIRFDNVSFHYPDSKENVLENISLSIDAGQNVAIIGSTGSGKSTLVSLLSRLYDTSSGEIYIDDKNIRDYNKKNLRNQIGLVLQEPFLFSKTIYDNINITGNNSEECDVHAVASVASLHHVIQGFDLGYHTVVGEKGVTLSGGQKQRLAIARTIIKDTPILIFDDSLSAVDSQTDKEIRSRMNEVSSDKTTIIITQRIATAKDSDIIFVLEDGKITQKGRHEQLVEEVGLYKRIHDIQTMQKEVISDESN